MALGIIKSRHVLAWMLCKAGQEAILPALTCAAFTGNNFTSASGLCMPSFHAPAHGLSIVHMHALPCIVLAKLLVSTAESRYT
jgi:hypothetical protein